MVWGHLKYPKLQPARNVWLSYWKWSYQRRKPQISNEFGGLKSLDATIYISTPFHHQPGKPCGNLWIWSSKLWGYIAIWDFLEGNLESLWCELVQPKSSCCCFHTPCGWRLKVLGSQGQNSTAKRATKPNSHHFKGSPGFSWIEKTIPPRLRNLWESVWNTHHKLTVCPSKIGT